MDLPALARAQREVISRAQALAFMTPAALRWRLESGRWRTLHPGVYQTHTGPLDWFARAGAALLFYGPDAALALHSAGWVLGIEDRCPQVLQIDTPLAAHRVRRPGVRLRRRRTFDTIRRRGLRLTAPAFTVIDIADLTVSSREDAIGVLARAVQRRTVTVPDVAAELGRRRAHRHRAALELSLGVVGEGAESVLEVDFVSRVLRAHGLPAMRMAVPDQVGNRSIRRDFTDDRRGLVIEVDGRIGHEGRRGADMRRDRATAAQGRLTLRCEWVDVRFEPCTLAADIHATLWSRGYRGGLEPCGSECPAAQASRRSA